MPRGLTVDSRGSGPDLVLVHGWGLASPAWGPLPGLLSGRFRVHVVDLPGYGARRALACPADLGDLAALLLDELPPARWVGWSLGGLVALAAAHQAPERIHGLGLIACNPRFVDPRERLGVAPAVFEDFRARVKRDPAAGLARFMGLVAAGEARPRQALVSLRQRLGGVTEPPLPVLLRGLEWLATADLAVPDAVPVHWQAGVNDRLVPIAAVPADAWRVPAAGHAPFLGREAETADWLAARLAHDVPRAASA